MDIVAISLLYSPIREINGEVLLIVADDIEREKQCFQSVFIESDLVNPRLGSRPRF